MFGYATELRSSTQVYTHQVSLTLEFVIQNVSPPPLSLSLCGCAG